MLRGATSLWSVARARNGACCVRIKTRRAVKAVSVRGDKTRRAVRAVSVRGDETRCGQMRFQLQNAPCGLVGTSDGHRMSRNGVIHRTTSSDPLKPRLHAGDGLARRVEVMRGARTSSEAALARLWPRERAFS